MCLPTAIMGGLAIAKGLTNYSAEKKEVNLQYARDLENQSLELKQYQAEKEGRYLEMLHQMDQLNNTDIETNESEAAQKGDIALAAQAAKSKMLASQASSGFAAGQGTFSNLLQSIGFEQSRDVNNVEMNAANQRVQTHTERRGAELGSRVPEPHISKIAKPDTSAMALGAGLSIATSLVGVGEKYGKLNSLGKLWG